MRALVFAFAAALSSCVGTTGSDLVTFEAAAAGPEDATGGPYTFKSGRGFDVTLTRARLTIGALYLNRSRPISGGQERACVLPGIYVGEVLEGRTVDALSPLLQPFPRPGTGTADRAITGEIWLTSGDVNEPSDAAVVLSIEGTASKDGKTYPFDGTVSIGRNRAVAATDPARPGANPICKQRIVSPIPIDLTPRDGGRLVLRVDPRAWFANVDFSEVPSVGGAPERFRFADDNGDTASLNLFRGLLASDGPYRFAWEAAR